MGLFSWWRAIAPSEADVRAEIWSLGSRYRGLPLDGALEELKTSDLAPARAQLLRACVRALKRQPATS